jgi:hypothetical protein
VGFSRAHPGFFQLFVFRRERREALLSVAIMRHCSIVKSEAENVMCRDKKNSNDDSNLCGGEELAW